MQISPGTTRFFPSIYLPHLLRVIPCSYWASACSAASPSCATLYVISVRQARGLPTVSLLPHPASFRFHLTVDTLAFGCILPATGRIRVFHPLETCTAGRTLKTGTENHLPFLFYMSSYSSARWILPLTVLGSSSRNTTIRGYLYGAVCCLT